ncbi:hypothetical protein [uncultured Sneathiella sp.]|uniref:hypothetical protein n=1 Tax=uncultured Sneathiella sp. TaxID=879315 RepID=UPI0030EE6FF5
MSYLPDSVAAMKATKAVKSVLHVGVLATVLSLSVSSFAPLAQANSDDPDYFRVKMDKGGTLNVRKNPSLKAQKVGALQAETNGIVNLGCHIGMPYLEWRNSTTAIRKVETRRKWCNIEYNGMTGWTAGQYLEADLPE